VGSSGEDERITLPGMRPSRRRRNDDLRRFDVLRGWPDDALELLVAGIDVVAVPPGTVIVRRGSHPREFVAVLHGQVASTDADGRISTYGPRREFGARELTCDLPHQATVTTTTPAWLLVVFGPTFRAAAHVAASRPVPHARRRRTAMAVPTMTPAGT
jgi:CRP-like cAMP-binding protein